MSIKRNEVKQFKPDSQTITYMCSIIEQLHCQMSMKEWDEVNSNNTWNAVWGVLRKFQSGSSDCLDIVKMTEHVELLMGEDILNG